MTKQNANGINGMNQNLIFNQKIWTKDSILRIDVLNLNVKSKQSVRFLITLNLLYTKDLTIASKNSQRAVVSFRDMKTGLLVANVRNVGTNVQFKSVTQEFQRQCVEAIREKFEYTLDELRKTYKSNRAYYEKTYRDLNSIEMEGYLELERATDILKQIKQQLGLAGPMAIPEVNQYLVFKDTELKDQQSTYRLNYYDPAKATLTDEQREIVEKFLSAFVDRENMDILSWYFGAMVTNRPIYDSHISKMMVVSSAGGGCGKNTLIGALTKALLTDNYRDIKPDFDAIFDKQNRFSTGDLHNVRATVYGEANFGLKNPEEHDFNGISVNELKSMISDGYISRERKFSDSINDRVSSLQIVLTNTFPDLNANRTDLTRRLLALRIKASRMEEKGRALNLPSEQDIYKYVEDNVQAFANYFATFYLANPSKFTNRDYDASDSIKQIEDDSKENAERKVKEIKMLKAAFENDPLSGLKKLTAIKGINSSKLMSAIEDAKITKNDDIRYADGKLYINSSRVFLGKLDAYDLRKYLLDFVNIEKKFHRNMFVIDLNENSPEIPLL